MSDIIGMLISGPTYVPGLVRILHPNLYYHRNTQIHFTSVDHCIFINYEVPWSFVTYGEFFKLSVCRRILGTTNVISDDIPKC